MMQKKKLNLPIQRMNHHMLIAVKTPFGISKDKNNKYIRINKLSHE